MSESIRLNKHTYSPTTLFSSTLNFLSQRQTKNISSEDTRRETPSSIIPDRSVLLISPEAHGPHVCQNRSDSSSMSPHQPLLTRTLTTADISRRHVITLFFFFLLRLSPNELHRVFPSARLSNQRRTVSDSESISFEHRSDGWSLSPRIRDGMTFSSQQPLTDNTC